MIEPNYDALPDEFKQKLAKWEANKPANLSLRALEDIALMVQDIGETVSQKGYGEDLTQLGTVLLDIRETMQAIRDKEDPETPDVTTPLLKAFDKLEKAIKESVGKIDVKPELKPNINVEAPNVTVAASKVDTSKIESILKKDLPQAFSEAIAAIPQSPETDNSRLEELLEEMSEQLTSIDTASRLKPQFPNTMKVTNPDGSTIGDSGGVTSYQVNDIEEAATSYFGFSTTAGDWLVKELTDTSVAYATVSNNGTVTSYTDAWTGRAGLTYGRFDEAF